VENGPPDAMKPWMHFTQRKDTLAGQHLGG
jgi:hypothetical protein